MSNQTHLSILVRKQKVVTGWIISYWWVVLPVVILARALFEPFRTGAAVTSLTDDSALFYYSGRQWVEFGRVPYRYLWDIKPPLIHELTAVLAFITRGNSIAIYVIGNAINVGAILGGITTSIFAVRELTDSKLAGAMTGFVCLAMPQLFARISTGLRPKYLVILLIGMVLLAGAREKWKTAAIAATLTAGLWQPGLAVLLIVLGTISWLVNYGELSQEVDDRVGVAVLSVATLIVLPIILEGAFPELLLQTVLAPLVTSDGGAGVQRIAIQVNPVIATVAAIGSVGAGIKGTHRVKWWPALLFLAFGLVAIKGDFDGVADLLPLSLVLAVGFGLAIGVARPPDARSRLADPRVWLLAVLAAQIWLAPDPVVPIRTSGEVRELFLSNTIKPRCHIRLSGPEQQLMDYVGSPKNSPVCWRPHWWP